MNKEDLQFYCRVCGYKNSDKPWGDDNISPTFNICPCCGVEFGYEDSNLNSIIIYRTNWLNNGCIWFNNKLKPVNWKVHEQLSNIPDNFKQ